MSRLIHSTLLLSLLAATSCSESSDATNVGPGPGSSTLNRFLANISAGTGISVQQSANAAPGTNGGPSLAVEGNTTVVNGGSGAYLFGTADSGGFDGIVVTVQGVTGHFLLSGQNTQAGSVRIDFSESLPAGTFQLLFAAQRAGLTGSYVGVSVTAQNVVSGALQVNLSWDTDADLDLHVVEPSGEEIFYGNRESAGGGVLDLDSNAACGGQDSRAENIGYANGAPSGSYTVRVNNWSECGNSASNFTVRVNSAGGSPIIRTGRFEGPGSGGGQGSGREITSFTFQ